MVLPKHREVPRGREVCMVLPGATAGAMCKVAELSAAKGLGRCAVKANTIILCNSRRASYVL